MNNSPKTILIVLLICISQFAKAQDTGTPVLRPIAIGVEFFNLDWSDYTNFYSTPVRQLTLSLNADGVRIEPSVGFLSTENKDSEEKVSNLSLGLGIYGLKQVDRINYQFGMAIKKLDVDYEDMEFEEKNESDIIQIGPSVGAEFMFSDRFSVSAKAGWSRFISKNTYEDDTNKITSKSKGWQSDSSIMIRFYF